MTIRDGVAALAYAFGFAVFLAAVVTLAAAIEVSAGSQPRWVSEACMTNGCIATILNSLPAERAAEAKLTTWGHTTYVWYRK